MSREVRRVPKDWKHPKKEDGKCIPLHDGDYRKEADKWTEEYAMWNRGYRRSYAGDEEWVQKENEHGEIHFSEWAGRCPCPTEYMPAWPDDERTHLMMYETCSEGTPISPAFETPEELAHWLADNNASSSGSMTATYEQWLSVCRSGWAPSAICDSKGFRSGVEALGDIVDD